MILEIKVSSVLVGRDVYPLFQAGKSLSSKVFILEMKIYPLFFQAGKIFLALRAKNKLSSVSGREVKCEVLVIWKVNNS